MVFHPILIKLDDSCHGSTQEFNNVNKFNQNRKKNKKVLSISCLMVESFNSDKKIQFIYYAINFTKLHFLKYFTLVYYLYFNTAG